MLRGLAADEPAAWRALDGVEQSLAAATPGERTAFGVEFLETVQNLVSHPDSGVDPAAVRERLGPATRRLWDELDAHWTKVADWVDAGGRSDKALTAEQVHGVTDGPLYGLIRGNNRTLPDGRVVGLADVGRHLTATGDEFLAS